MDSFPPPGNDPQDPQEKRDVLAPPPGTSPGPPRPPADPAPQPPPPTRQEPSFEQPAPAQQPAPVQAPPAGAVFADGTWFLPAGFWARAGAFAIDFIILSLLSSILVWMAGVPEPDFDETMRVMSKLFSTILAGGMPSDALLAQLEALQAPARFAGWLNVAMCGAYFTLMHGLAATTLGKLCFGLTVLRRDGRPLGPWVALGRYLLYFVCAKLIYTAWLIPLNAERRTLYDMLTSTNVFRAVRH